MGRSMGKVLSELFDIIRDTIDRWGTSEVVRLASGISYYAATSILSLLAVIVLVSSLLVVGDGSVRSEIVNGFEEFIGQENAQAINQALAAASEDIRRSSPAPALGIVIILLYNASRLFRRLRDALNVIWDAEHANAAGGGVKKYVKDTVLSLAAAVIVGIILLLVLLLNSAAFVAVDILDRLLPEANRIQLWQAVGYLLLLGVTSVIFTLIYRLMPDVRLPWRIVLIGGMVTAILFTLGQFVISWYFDLTNSGTIFGILGSFLVILLWVYVCVYIVMFGAIFTYVLYQRRLELKPVSLPPTDFRVSAPDGS